MKYKFEINSLVKNNRNLLAASCISNALYYLNINSFKVSFITLFDGEDYFQTNLISGGVETSNEIIYFPCFGKYIHIFDKKTMIETQRINFKNRDDDQIGLFLIGQYGHKIYLTTYNLSHLYVFSINDYEVLRKPILRNTCKDLNDFIIVSTAESTEGKLLVVGKNYAGVLCLDLFKETVTEYCNIEEETGFESILVYKSEVYLLPNNRRYILKLGKEYNEHYDLVEPVNDISGSIVKNGIWIIGYLNSDTLIYFDIRGKSISYKKILNKAHCGEWRNQPSNTGTDFCLIYGDDLFIYYVDKFDEKMGYMSFDKKCYAEWVKSNVSLQYLIKEGEMAMALADFINCVLEVGKNPDVFYYKNIGDEIYNML